MYSKISVNGEYIGVYLALEGVEDSFMLRNYGTKNGELYKPENMGFGDGPSEGDLSTIEDYMDIDNLLKYMAVHEFAVNGDSLSGNMAHNYYLYESDGQLNIIPWDYNLSFGGMFGGGPGRDSDGGRSSGATSMINDPIDDSWQSTNFFDILLENEEYSAKYHEYLSMLVDYVENGGYEKLTQRLHSQIDELVETDPTSFYTYDEYKAAYTMLDEVVHLRAESIKGQLDKTIPSTSEGQKEDASSLIDASAIDTSVMGRMGMGNNDNGKKEEPVQSSSSTENSR